MHILHTFVDAAFASLDAAASRTAAMCVMRRTAVRGAADRPRAARGRQRGDTAWGCRAAIVVLRPAHACARPAIGGRLPAT